MKSQRTQLALHPLTQWYLPMTRSKKCARFLPLLCRLMLALTVSFGLFGCRDESTYPEFPDHYKYGFVDRKGRFVIPPKYGKATSFSDGTATVYNRLPPEQDTFTNGRGYILDKNGKVLKKFIDERLDWDRDYRMNVNKATPRKEMHQNESDKLLTQAWSEKAQKVGFKNKAGQWVIPPQWDEVTEFENGIAFVNLFNIKTGQDFWGLIDYQGNYLLKPICMPIWNFHDDRALCRVGYANGKIYTYEMSLTLKKREFIFP